MGAALDMTEDISSLLVSVATTVTLCQLEASRSSGWESVMEPLFGSILKAFLIPLCLSIEYLKKKNE